MIGLAMKVISSFFNEVMEGWSIPRDTWLSRWLDRIWIAALFLIGLVQWASYLKWGNIPLEMGDWGDINTPRLLVLQDAVRRWILPLHIPVSTGMKGVTDRFLAIPDIIFSPQILLLRVVGTGTFVLIDLLLMFSIGYIGLLLLRRRYQLSLFVFSVIFLIFNFNGHIVDHIFIGHITWFGYFLTPLFVLLVCELLEKPQGWGWVSKTVFVLLGILLQGGFHLYVISLLFLGLFGLFNRRILKLCWITAAFALLAGSFRLLPASLVTQALNIGYLGGFTTVNELIRGLVTLIEPENVAQNVSRLNPYVAWWEFDFYIGWIGLACVGCAFIFSWWKKLPQIRTYAAVLLPSLALILLSIGRIYRFVFLLQIPMLDGERVGSRIFVLPFLFGLMISGILAQRVLDRYPPNRFLQLSFLGIFLLLFNDLQQHFESWGLDRMYIVASPNAINPLEWVVQNRPDAAYETTLIAGAILSILAIGGLILLWSQAKKADPWLGSASREFDLPAEPESISS